MLCCFQAVDGAGKDSTTPMRGPSSFRVMKAVSSSYERRKQDSPTLALCYNPASFFRQSGENTVNRHVTVGLVMIASAALGAAAVQTLHAQAKPPAYNIVEITIKDQDGYNKEYLPPITKAIADAGGKFLVRGGKTISYEGAAPAPRVVVVQFESLDKLQALYNSVAYKDAIAIGDKYATQRIFGVEGVSP